MKIYLDDERQAPDGWLLCRWPEEVIAHLRTGQVVALSLDHDLGDVDDRRSGYTVLLWIEEQVATTGFVPPTEIRVHSANASAKQKMLLAIENIGRLCSIRGRQEGQVISDDPVTFSGPSSQVRVEMDETSDTMRTTFSEHSATGSEPTG
jgi:hypothetical protein